jgi:DNA-binding response OmpR family regulator
MIGYGKRVLVVDYDETERQETALALGQEGFTVVQARDGLDALSEMQKRRFDAVVTDCQMPQLNGLDFLAQSRVVWSDTPVILFSETRWDMSEMAAARGAFAWIRKSSDFSFLLSMLAVAVEQGVRWESKHAMQRVGA